MDVIGDSTRRTLAPAGSLAFGVLVLHVFLLACLGQAYAKVQVGPVYTTEIALGLAAAAALPHLRELRWDTFSKLAAGLCLLAAGWVVLRGLGESGGAGTKAFSFFIYSGFYVVTRAVVTTEEQRHRLLGALTAAALVGAALGFWQMHTGSPLLGTADFEVTSTGSTRWLGGEFALYGMFAAMIVLVQAVVSRRLTGTSLWLLGAATAELVLAQHRSGFLAFAVAALATAAFLLGSAQGLKRLFKIGLLIAIAVTVLVWVFGGDYIDETIARIASMGDTSDVNIDWRLVSWYEVFDGVRGAPLGHGFAVWDFLFTADNPLTGSHNSYLDLAYRIGVPGVAVFMAMPVALIRQTRATVRDRGADGQTSVIAVCGCMLAFLVFASFNVVLETPYMSIFFWILLGIGAGSLAEARRA